jgi:hypothetical protein
MLLAFNSRTWRTPTVAKDTANDCEEMILQCGRHFQMKITDHGPVAAVTKNSVRRYDFEEASGMGALWSICALALAFAGLAMILVARNGLSHSARIMQSGAVGPGEGQLHISNYFLYASWILAIGSAEFLRLAFRQRQLVSPWAIVFLLGAFLYLNFAE